MASTGDPMTNPVFDNELLEEEEDLLDDEEEDDDDSEPEPEREPEPEDDSTSDHHHHHNPNNQVTIALSAPDLAQFNHQHQQQTQHQHHDDVIVPATAAKKPTPDESRKLFQRLWTDEDEIELLQGFLDYTSHRGGAHNSHHHDTTAFYDQIKSKFQLDFNKNQLVEKLRRLKKKYRNVISKFGSGKDYAFKTPHEQATFEISSKIWGPINGGGGSSAYAYRATPVSMPIPIDDDEDDCGSPNPNGMIDVNSKTSRPRKRNRSGTALKFEDSKQVPFNASYANNNNNGSQPSMGAAAAPMQQTPTPTPGMGGAGVAGSFSSVIEETVKSCLSPVFKELLTSMSNQNAGGHQQQGFAFALSPMPLGFAGGLGGGGDRIVSDEKWRKQQILELEVFSKRLELVQNQINEQLMELRSMGK